jgi:glycosyltransferase involved in cell wall biosynthesis
MHIGFTSSESPYGQDSQGGISSYLQAIIPPIVGLGHRVTLLAFAHKNERIQQFDGRLEIIHLKRPSLHWYLSRIGAAGRWLALWVRQLEWSHCFYRALREVDQHEPLDIIECTEVGGLFLPRLKPTVIRLHGSRWVFDFFMAGAFSKSTRLEMHIQKKMYRRATALSSPSVFQADQVKNLLGLEPKTVILPNPLDDFWVEASQKDHERLISTPPLLLYVGRVAPVKGIQILLKALELMADEPFRCVLAGEWQMPDDPEVYGIDPEHRWRGKVLWLGHQDRQELLDWYRQAALFIMPSLYETFGLSVVEAMAMGLPVIASRAGALQERITHQANGLLVPPGDPTALADGIRSALRQPETLKRLGQAGQRSVQDQYSSKRIAQEMITAYQNILAVEGSKHVTE